MSRGPFHSLNPQPGDSRPIGARGAARVCLSVIAILLLVMLPPALLLSYAAGWEVWRCLAGAGAVAWALGALAGIVVFAELR